MILLKRAYEPPLPTDGCRVLIDRLWPRGVRREMAKLDRWERELAPSEELRRWYGHAPSRFPEFRERYRAELAGASASLDELVRTARRGTLTLVFASREEARSNAAVLRELLEERLR